MFVFARFGGESAALPWFLPGAVISVAVGLAASDRIGRALGVRRAVALALIVSLGMILSATLTPLRGVLEIGAVDTGSCDFSRVGLAPLKQLLAVNDTSLNVLLFMPLGVSIALLPRSRRTLVAAIAAILLPFAVEVTQLLVPLLGRGCQSADVVDNLTGLAIGLVGGVTVRLLVAALDPGPH